MKVLFVAPRWDYGDPNRGPSFEYTNMFDALRRMAGVDAHFHDILQDHANGGPSLVAARLRQAVTELEPDLLFAVLFTDEVPGEVLAELRDAPAPVTFNWFCDDHWRFESFTARYAPLFNFCSTTSRQALAKYARIGYDRVLKTQWGCNHHLYKPSGRPPRIDVSFVGQPHGDRRWVIRRLRAKGVDVATWGHGWDAGRLGQQEMIDTFAESRVNLNLSNASQNPGVPAMARKVLNRVYPPALKLWKAGRLEQIKGRNFEIPSCGGFQISGDADDITTYFEPDREIVLYRSQAELQAQIHRYLADEPARQRIATAGYRRALAEHTYEARYTALFDAMDLPAR